MVYEVSNIDPAHRRRLLRRLGDIVLASSLGELVGSLVTETKMVSLAVEDPLAVLNDVARLYSVIEEFAVEALVTQFAAFSLLHRIFKSN